MARIYKKGKQSLYYFCLEIGRDKNGKRQRIVRGGFKLKKDAQAAAARLEAQICSGSISGKESAITLHEFLWNHWLQYHKDFIKPTTRKSIEFYLRRIDRFFGTKIQLRNVTASACQKLASELIVKDKLKRAVARQIMAYFRKAIQYAIRIEKILNSDPTKYVAIPRQRSDEWEAEHPSKPLYLEKDVLKAFFEKCSLEPRDFSYSMASIIMIYTGMRASEAIALQWEDIDFDECIIHVRHGCSYLKAGKFVVQTPKTKSSRRDIPIRQQLITELKNYRKQFLQFKMVNASRWYNSGYDFVLTSFNYPGRPFSVQSMEQWLQKINRRIGIDYLRPHLFRHTHVSLLAEELVPLEVISARLGHTSSEITRKIYLHVTKDSSNAAADGIENIMRRIRYGT